MRLRTLLLRTPLCSKKKGNNDLNSFNFIYFILGNFNVIENIGGEVNNSDNFVLNKYIVRSSLYINTMYNKLVIHNLFYGMISFIVTICTFEMAGYFLTLAILN